MRSLAALRSFQLAGEGAFSGLATGLNALATMRLPPASLRLLGP